ncbi:MAG: hypothetical protein ACKOWD_05250 [Rhodoferax sp.]
MIAHTDRAQYRITRTPRSVYLVGTTSQQESMRTPRSRSDAIVLFSV